MDQKGTNFQHTKRLSLGLLAMPETYQVALSSNRARAAPIPRRKAALRATPCAVRCSGVPIAVLNRSSIRAAVAMNCSGSMFNRSRIRGVSPVHNVGVPELGFKIRGASVLALATQRYECLHCEMA